MTSTPSSAASTDAYTCTPSSDRPRATPRSMPAADRATAERSTRSSAARTPSTRAGPAHPVAPAMQTPITPRGAASRSDPPGSEAADGAPQQAPERDTVDAPPRRADCSAQALELTLPALQVGGDHLGLVGGEAAGVGHQELAGQRDRHVGVVEPSEMVLERHHPGGELARPRAELLAEELERVAQPLRSDPELVNGLDVRPAQDTLVPADLLVGEPDARPGGVPDAVRADRAGGREDGRALRRDEDPVFVDQARRSEEHTSEL